jgi:fatty acid desaturase
MAQTQRKPVYVQPEHHDILRRIAYEQRCQISDVLDAVLEQTDWEKIAKEANNKPVQRARERGGSYKV